MGEYYVVKLITFTIFKIIFNLVDQDICGYDKTYDGAPVMSGGVGGLQTKVKEKYPEALFDM